MLISCTDWLDGYLARSRGEVTDFGKFMDPLADKILVAAALFALVELGVLPSWVALIIVAREFIVSGVRMVAASKGVVISASWYGKFKTVSQMIAIVMFTVKDSYMMGTLIDAFSDMMWVLSWAVMFVALALTIVSMLDYISKARDLIGLGPRKGKKAKASPSAKPKASRLHERATAGPRSPPTKPRKPKASRLLTASLKAWPHPCFPRRASKALRSEPPKALPAA